jgi:hypothetical protein
VWFPGFHRLVAWRANRLLRRRLPERAISWNDAYTRLRPGDPQGWVLLTEVLLSRAQYDVAALVAEQALGRHPTSAMLSYQQLIAVVRQGRLDEAEAMIAEKVPINQFLVSLANVELLNARGDHEGLLAAARRTAELIPPITPGPSMSSP